MDSSNTAYDFSLFEDKKRELKSSRPELKEIKSKNKKASRISPFKATLVCLLFIGVFSMFIYSYVLLNESKGAVNLVSSQLNKAIAEDELLDVELEKLLSIGNIEQYATNELGLCKRDQHQIEYIKTEQDNKIIVLEKKDNIDFISELNKLFKSISESIIKMFN